MLFLYASPKELDPLAESTFLEVLSRRETKSDTSLQPYFYGFIEKDTSVARTLQLVEGIVKTSCS